MSSQEIVPTSSLLPSSTVFTQTGDNGLQIQNVQNLNLHVNAASFQVPLQLPEWNLDCYNLIVINDDLDTGRLLMPAERALTESINPILKERLSRLGDAAIQELLTYPALIANENEQYGTTTPEQLAYFARLSGIKVQDNGVRIYYRTLSPVPQLWMNQHRYELGLGYRSGFNELNRTHWTVKRVNLVEVFEDADIEVMLPSSLTRTRGRQ